MTFPQAPPPDKTRGRRGCAVALMSFVGVILTLPGLCSFIFMIALSRDGGSAGDLAGLWFMTYLVAGLGVLMIVFAVRGR